MNPKDVFILDTIVVYCDRIFSAVERYDITKERFLADEHLQDMLAFCMIQIGEYAKDLSAEFVNLHGEIDWHKIVSFRNLIVHNYGSFIPEILWDAIETNIPTLREFCAAQIGA